MNDLLRKRALIRFLLVPCVWAHTHTLLILAAGAPQEGVEGQCRMAAGFSKRPYLTSTVLGSPIAYWDVCVVPCPLRGPQPPHSLLLSCEEGGGPPASPPVLLALQQGPAAGTGFILLTRDWIREGKGRLWCISSITCVVGE